MKYRIHLPMKMEPIVSSETSAIRTQTPGNYPKRNKLQTYSSITVPAAPGTGHTTCAATPLQRGLIGTGLC